MLSLSQPLVLTPDGPPLIFKAEERMQRPHLQICPEVKCQIQYVLNCLFQEHEQDKATSRGNTRFSHAGFEKEESFATSFLLPYPPWNSEERFGGKKRRKFYFCQPDEPINIYNADIFHAFPYGKITTVVKWFCLSN